MEMTNEIRELLNETRENLSGYARRHFMAQTVKTMCDGNGRKAARELGWNRETIRKGLEELEGGFCYIDRQFKSGRKKAEEILPNLLKDIEEIASQYSQTDPTFRTTRLYTRLTAAEVRRQLSKEKGYREEELPCEETIRVKLNQLGYGLKRVKKVNL